MRRDRNPKDVKKRLCICLFSLMTCLFVGTAQAAGSGQISITVTQDYGKAKEVLSLVNKARAKQGFAALKADSRLTQNAVTRAAELCAYVPTGTHYRPNGKEKSSINGAIIYEDCLESIGSGISAESGFNAWMASPPHKRGILLSSARSVGVACVTIETPEGVNEHFVLEFSGKSSISGKLGTGTKQFTVKVQALSKYLGKKCFAIVPHYTDTGLELRVRYKSPAGLGTYLLSPASFKWSSSNKAAAKVSSKGVVTKVGEGKTTFTAISKKAPKIKLTISSGKVF